MVKRISFSSEGYLGFSLPRLSAYFAKDGALFSISRVFYEKTNPRVKIFLKNSCLGKHRLYKGCQIVYVCFKACARTRTRFPFQTISMRKLNVNDSLLFGAWRCVGVAAAALYRLFQVLTFRPTVKNRPTSGGDSVTTINQPEHLTRNQMFGSVIQSRLQCGPSSS
jgi:hypothetical protein